MNKLILAIGILGSVFLAGQYSVTYAYDPSVLEEVALQDVINEYYLGCIKGGGKNDLCQEAAAKEHDQIKSIFHDKIWNHQLIQSESFQNHQSGRSHPAPSPQP